MTDTERKAELKEQAKAMQETVVPEKPPETLPVIPTPEKTIMQAPTQPTPTPAVIERSDEFKKFQEQKAITEYYMGQEALPKNLKAGQAMMIIELGKQVGLNMFEALNGLAFVNGRITMWGEVMISKLTKSGYKIKFLESTPETCKVEISGPNGSIEEEFTREEAKKAGFGSRGVWLSQPKIMLRYKAIRQGVKFLCPEVMGGIMTKEEAETEIVEGEIVNEAEVLNTLADKFKK